MTTPETPEQEITRLAAEHDLSEAQVRAARTMRMDLASYREFASVRTVAEADAVRARRQAEAEAAAQARHEMAVAAARLAL